MTISTRAAEMQIDTDAIVCAVRNHGEHGGIVRLLTPAHGLIAAYVRGARGRRMRPVLIPGNLVAVQLRARSEAQLPQATIELGRSRAALLGEPIAAAALGWIADLLAAVLPERQQYPAIFAASAALLDAIEAAPSAKGWGSGLARVELLILAELGYARRDAPQATGSDVDTADWAKVIAALDRSGRLLEREILADRPAMLIDGRNRLMDRLRRAAGDSLPASLVRPTSGS